MNKELIQNEEDSLKIERENFEKEKNEWKNNFNKEAKSLQEELDLMNQYKESIVMNISKDKESSLIQKLKQDQNYNVLALELENLEESYKSKFNEIETLKKIFNEEKENFERSCSEMNKNLEEKKLDLEKKKLELIQGNSRINNKYLFLQEKENYLKDKKEDYDTIYKMVIDLEEKNKRSKINLDTMALKLEDYFNEIISKEKINGTRKEELQLDLNQIKLEKNAIENEKINLEQNQVELNYRFQNLENLVSQYNEKGFYSQNQVPYFLSYGIKSPNVKNIREIEYQKFLKNNQLYDHKIRNIEKFNANQYLLCAKNRIITNKIKMEEKFGDSNNGINTAQEEEYLIKSHESINKTHKNLENYIK